MEYRVGKFKCVKDQAWADFFIKFGLSPEVTKKSVGFHETMEVMKIGDNKLLIRITCEEDLSKNSCETFEEGKEGNHLEKYLGQAKVVFHRDGLNSFCNNINTESHGLLVRRDTYTPEGCAFVYEAKGETYGMKWERIVNITGTYRFSSGTGHENFPLLYKWLRTSDLTSPDYKLYFEEHENGFRTVNYVGGEKVETVAKLHEEVICHLDKNVSKLYTRAGPGHFKLIEKCRDGHIQEWEMRLSPCQSKLYMTCKDHENGKSMNLILDKFVDFSGQWKVVCYDGMKRMCEAMGADYEMAKKTFDDPQFRIVTDHRGLVVSTKMLVGDRCLMDSMCKLGEEYTMKFSMMPNQAMKCISECQGDTLWTVAKGNATYKFGFKVTNNFCIRTTEIVGTGLKDTFIYQKI